MTPRATGVYADPRWHVYVAYAGAAWIEGPFATEAIAHAHKEALRRRKGSDYYLRLVRRETPEAACPCREPNPPGYPPCTPDKPCGYARLRIEGLWS